MMDPASLVSNPAAGFVVRVAFGSYVVYMARQFYADPLGYFRRSARRGVELQWLTPVIRVLAVFCLWGGCFIGSTAIAVQVFGLRGDWLAVALIAVAALAAWLLLPRGRAGEGRSAPDEDRSGG